MCRTSRRSERKACSTACYNPSARVLETFNKNNSNAILLANGNLRMEFTTTMVAGSTPFYARAGLRQVPRQYPDPVRDAVVHTHPRPGPFKQDIIQAFYDGIRHKPDTTFGNVKADVLS